MSELSKNKRSEGLRSQIRFSDNEYDLGQFQLNNSKVKQDESRHRNSSSRPNLLSHSIDGNEVKDSPFRSVS